MKQAGQVLKVFFRLGGESLTLSDIASEGPFVRKLLEFLCHENHTFSLNFLFLLFSGGKGDLFNYHHILISLIV